MNCKHTQNMSRVLFAAKIAAFLAMSVLHGCGRWGEGYADYDFETAKSELETEFPIRFPKEIAEGRVGKRTLAHAIDYIVRFSANPELVDEFLDSFPEGYKRVPYTASKDLRLGSLIAPEWFKASISKGYKITDHFIGSSGKGTVRYIYINTQNPDKHTVYMAAILPRKQANE